MIRILISCFILMHATLQAQTAMSRVGARFPFQVAYPFGDSTSLSVVLPVWHPYAFASSGGFVGALNRYGLMSLTECVAGGNISSSLGSMRWLGSASGDGNYQQALAQVSLIRKLGERFQFGTGIGLSYVGVSGYGSRWIPVGSVTAGGWIGKRLVWGMSWDNPQRLLLTKERFSHSPMRVVVGAAQALSDRLSIYGGMEWESGISNGSVIRLVYRPALDWRVDIGCGWRPDQIQLGVHRKIKSGWFVLSFSQELALGSSFYFGYTWIGRKRF